jgi:hypothetical protein
MDYLDGILWMSNLPGIVCAFETEGELTIYLIDEILVRNDTAGLRKGKCERDLDGLPRRNTTDVQSTRNNVRF